jgi:predicted metal-dependent enzyme (double-stranded beta helix superfamily)
MSIDKRRKEVVLDAVDRVRRVMSTEGIAPATLQKVKGIICDLAAHRDLFTFEAFPLPVHDSGEANCLYLVSEDSDHSNSLYVNVSRPGKSTAPHNHTTWAVVVGVRGEELNRLYERTDDGKTPGKGSVRQVGEFNVTPGTGICFMPEDIHSIHVETKEPILHFHMYGTGLEYLYRRIGFDVGSGTCKVYPPHRDIRKSA